MKAGTMDLMFLAPARERLTGEINQDGIVLLLRGEGAEVLFMGDLEKEGEKAFADHYAKEEVFGGEDMFTVLSAGHHGSRFATSEQLLDLVRPDLAVISCGKNNRYGHPAPEVVERLKKAGAAVKRTDLDGAVTVESRQHVTGHTDMCVLQW